MNIGIDVMGGDYAPEAVVLGAAKALKKMSASVGLFLIGDQDKVYNILQAEKVNPDAFTLVHTNEWIEMGEHPAKAFSQKPLSTISLGYKMLVKGEIDGFASAGNTGAMLVGISYTVKSVPGIIRPTIPSFVPAIEGGTNVLLDVGINPDCKPDVLYQYGILGSLYAQHVLSVKNPRVALLNIGSEESKGNLVVRATYELMKGTSEFNFVGNIEGNEIFSSEKADVIICDGFVGNVILKEAEALYSLIRKREIKDPFFERFNFENYGGTPVLGVNNNVIIGHGISNDTAIMNMILHTRDVIEADLTTKIKEAFK